jgi:hypothetical protein
MYRYAKMLISIHLHEVCPNIGNICHAMGVSTVMGVPKNGWFIREHPIKIHDLGVAVFQETSIWSKNTICFEMPYTPKYANQIWQSKTIYG